MSKRTRERAKITKEQMQSIQTAKPTPIVYNHVLPVKHTVSAVMIVKNEEDMLRECLDSLKGAVNEIIILDTGSTDKTMEIAREYTDKVYSKQYKKWSFSQARTDSMKYATSAWSFIIDADERLNCNVNLDDVIEEAIALGKDAIKVQFDDVQNGTHVSRCISNCRLQPTKNFKFTGKIHNQIIGYKFPLITNKIAIKHVGYSNLVKSGRTERIEQTNTMLADELKTAHKVQTRFIKFVRVYEKIRNAIKNVYYTARNKFYGYISRASYLRWQMGVMAYSRQEFEKAIEHFNNALVMKNFMSDTVIVQAYGYLQQCFLALFQFKIAEFQKMNDEAKEQFKPELDKQATLSLNAINGLFMEATRRDPNFVDAYFNFGIVCAMTGRWYDAKNLLIKYMELREQPARYEIMWYSYPRQQEAINMIQHAQNEITKLEEMQKQQLNKIK